MYKDYNQNHKSYHKFKKWEWRRVAKYGNGGLHKPLNLQNVQKMGSIGAIIFFGRGPKFTKVRVNKI